MNKINVISTFTEMKSSVALHAFSTRVASPLLGPNCPSQYRRTSVPGAVHPVSISFPSLPFCLGHLVSLKGCQWLPIS